MAYVANFDPIILFFGEDKRSVGTIIKLMLMNGKGVHASIDETVRKARFKPVQFGSDGNAILQ